MACWRSRVDERACSGPATLQIVTQPHVHRDEDDCRDEKDPDRYRSGCQKHAALSAQRMLGRWEISANLGPHRRPGAEANGFLWEITRGDRVAQVLVDFSTAAWSSDPLELPRDTRAALATGCQW
jgi:hypothetical protein